MNKSTVELDFFVQDIILDSLDKSVDGVHNLQINSLNGPLTLKTKPWESISVKRIRRRI